MTTRGWRIATVGGVPLRLDASVLIAVGFIGLVFGARLSELNPEASDAQVTAAAALTSIVFFLSILLHETAHALMARRRGLEVRSVTLFVFGGVTEIDQEAKTPGDELRITIVGPLTSLLLGVALLVGANLAGDTDDLWPGAVAYLGVINLTLGVFNLLPGFPLDGGRVLRSIVWARSGDRPRATQLATSAGDTVGWILVALGVLGLLAGSLAGFWTIAIGLFLSMSARAAGFQARLADSLNGRVAADLMSPEPTSVDADQLVADAVQTTLLHDDHRLYPVIRHGATVGLLRVEDVRSLSTADRETTPVASVMIPIDTATAVAPSTPGTEVLERLGAGGPGTRLVVVRGDDVVGVIAPEDLERWLRRTDDLGLGG